MKSYAQNFEDVMLERVFQDNGEGFYVDIGAWDPDRHSVTKHFYDRGWRGINVEPIEERVAAFEQKRARDINLCAAVSSQDRPLRLWVCDKDSALSTTNEDHANHLRSRGLTMSERTVQSRRLDAILAEFAPGVVDFLKIDVEGAEADVLATIDINRWRPRVIVVEATEAAAALSDWAEPEQHARWAEWEPKLLGANYVFAHFDGLNRFYVRSEDQALARRFQLPPCVFDQIENIDLEYQTTLLNLLNVSEQDRAARLVIIERLDAAIKDLQDRTTKDLQDRLDRTKELQAKLAQSDAVNAEQLRLIDELRHPLRTIARKGRSRVGHWRQRLRPPKN